MIRTLQILWFPTMTVKKQYNLRQFKLLNVKQCTEAPSNIQHASEQARVYVRAKAKRIKAYKCVAYAKKERKICFQVSVKYRRVDGTVWNHNIMSPLVTPDPLERKNNIRLLNGTNNKTLQYNKSFTLLEDHFQERLEQFQTPFTVYQLKKMYAGTFTFVPADKNWIYDPNQNQYHNCPAHHQYEVNLVSWRLEISEIEITYDDIENVIIIDGHTLPCFLPMDSVNRLRSFLLLLFGSVMILSNIYNTRFPWTKDKN